ncbi:MAG: trigger factor [Patescibacteria group bacterium]
MKTKVETKKLPKAQIEITGEIPEEKFEEKRKDAVKNLAHHVEIDGFRKGMAPESVLVKKLGAMVVLEEMAHLALNEAYSEIIIENELDVIGAPEITITKIAPGNPLGFKIVSAIVPEIELPDYKKITSEIAKKKEEVYITDQEVENTITEIRKQRAVKKNSSAEAPARTEGNEEPIVPELTDEFAKSLGDFENVLALKEKIKENMKLEKELRTKEKTRLEIIERITAEIKTEIPDVLIESETEKLLMRMRGDIERMGLKFDDYLKNLKKTEGDFRKEWRSEGEKRAKIELTLVKIAKIENIKPKNEDVEKEVKHILEHYKDAKDTRVRDYVTSLLTSEKVFEFLENQGAKQ